MFDLENAKYSHVRCHYVAYILSNISANGLKKGYTIQDIGASKV